MNIQSEEQETAYNSAYNPFPEPQTIPSGWDTSGFLAPSQSDPDMDKADSAEN